MTQDTIRFDEFLWESFRDGETLRELRLSQEELAYLAARYPLESWEPLGGEQGGKCWYRIRVTRPPSTDRLLS